LFIIAIRQSKGRGKLDIFPNKSGHISKLILNVQNIKDILTEASHKRKVAQLARDTGIDPERIYKWIKRGVSDIKASDAEKILKWANMDKSTKPESVTSEPLTIQALVNLTESNKILAESNKTLATSHAELVTMVKGSTVSDLPESVQDDSATLKDLLEVLADVGVAAKKWHSKEEGLAALHRISVEYLKRKQVVDTRSGSGTKNRAKA
jgi:hypothetical protein